MKKIISFILVLMLTFMLVGCGQNEQIDEMAQKITQLEQALQNQADVNNEVSAELEQQKSANEWLGQLILTQQGVIDKQQTQIGRAEEAIDNLLGKPIEFTESAPVYGPREGEIMLKEFIAYDRPYDEEKGEELDGYALEGIKNYYKTEFRELFNEEFFLLEPKDYVYCPGEPGAVFQASVYAEEIEEGFINPIIREDFHVADLALRHYEDHWDRVLHLDGGWWESVHLDVYFAPYPDFISNFNIIRRLSISFGKGTVADEEATYFNIYISHGYDSVCIGTCYYTLETPLTSRWFEKYIINNLFKMEE